MLRQTLLALAVMTAPAFAESVPSNDGTETPKFEVIAEGTTGIQVRRYAPVIEAFTTVEADNARAASQKAFMTVAGYIFGANEGSDKIAMTAPVNTTSGTRIDMTAPVTTEAKGKAGTTLDEKSAYTIAFMMPSKWTMETLPKPKDAAVKLRQVQTELRAALPFKGERDAKAVAEIEKQLRSWLEENDWTMIGAPSLAGYDGPRVPSNERRYEVMIPVAAK